MPKDAAPAKTAPGTPPVPPPDQPSVRPLKVYAFDPSSGRHLGNQMTLNVRYERLVRGPAGRMVAVVDYDAANKCYYDPVNLDDSGILMRGGLDPSEGDPQFHQQMVYAVAMETIQEFEAALGRRIHWRLGDRWTEGRARRRGVRSRQKDITVLKLYPHAMMERNAFYSPKAHGILFGYFRASTIDPGRNLPGQAVFTCLSHDIIAHEVTHAVIDGIRGYFTEATNVDVAAFHEAFADLVALFRHFSHKAVLLDVIQKTGGRLFDMYLSPTAGQPDSRMPPMVQEQNAANNPLIELARQFGDATGRNRGLRSALGTFDPKDYQEKREPHERGSILVAAVFDAYFTIYLRRTANLFRLYRAGGGGFDARGTDVPMSLADLLAAEASRTAQQFFRLCVRALDYCPPVDIRFGDFLRAVVTAHRDLQPEDEDGVRAAFMEAFRLRGILPEGASFFSEDALSWPRSLSDETLPRIKDLEFGDPNGLTLAEKNRIGTLLRGYAKRCRAVLGLDPTLPVTVPSFHPVFRVGGDGRLRIDMVAEFVQVRDVVVDPAVPALGSFPLRGGATIIISKPMPGAAGRQSGGQIRFVIAKHLQGPEGAAREERQREYYARHGLLQGDPSDPSRFRIDFAAVHGGL